MHLVQTRGREGVQKPGNLEEVICTCPLSVCPFSLYLVRQSRRAEGDLGGAPDEDTIRLRLKIVGLASVQKHAVYWKIVELFKSKIRLLAHTNLEFP